MPVLIIAIASYVIFFGVLLLLWIAGKLELREARLRSRSWLENPLPILSIAQAFDPDYSVLWEAPCAALALVDAAGPCGLPVSRLRPVYRKAAAGFPEIYDGCSFVQWLGFLEQSRLAICDGYRVVLTEDGHEFLKYRFTTGRVLKA
jgi:hypothetical protein